jgi:hypothetical protein
MMALNDDVELATCRKKPPMGAGAPLLLHCQKCRQLSSINASNNVAVNRAIAAVLALDDVAFGDALVAGVEDGQRAAALRSSAPLFRAALQSKDVLLNTSMPLPLPGVDFAQLIIGKLRLDLMTHSYRHTFRYRVVEMIYHDYNRLPHSLNIVVVLKNKPNTADFQCHWIQEFRFVVFVVDSCVVNYK